MSLPPQQLFAEIYQRHGHRCPMSTLGGRIGFAARERLAGSELLTATYFIDTCAADGISVMTGCSKDKETLRIAAQNRHALWLQNDAGSGIFAELSSQALDLAGTYRTLDQTFEKDAPGLPPKERQERRLARDLFLEDLLQQLWSLPDDELMTFATALPAGLACACDGDR